MTKIQKLGATDDPLDGIEDAVFVELDEPQNAREGRQPGPAGPSLVEWWDKRPPTQKLVFVSLGVIAGILLISTIGEQTQNFEPTITSAHSGAEAQRGAASPGFGQGSDNPAQLNSLQPAVLTDGATPEEARVDEADNQGREQVEARYSSEFKSCMSTGDAANGVTAGIMDCNGLEIDRQDRRLNESYASAMKELSGIQKTELRNSERSWIRRRDAECNRQAAFDAGGTLAAMVYSSCYLDETIKRAMWLETYRP